MFARVLLLLVLLTLAFGLSETGRSQQCFVNLLMYYYITLQKSFLIKIDTYEKL